MKTLFSCLFFLSSQRAVADAKFIKPILESNDALFASLLGDDQKLVATSASQLLVKINATKDKKLNSISTSLKKITDKNSKKDNLDLYSKFMEGFLPLAKEHGLGNEYLVYYCPMVKKYWLQNNKLFKKTQNVFAQEMLECGGKV